MLKLNKVTLENIKVGDWVDYHPPVGVIEKGRVKSWNDKWIFVVYNCDDKWDDFENYTGAATSPEYLTFKKEVKK